MAGRHILLSCGEGRPATARAGFGSLCSTALSDSGLQAQAVKPSAEGCVVAGVVDVCLIPEIPFQLDMLIDYVKQVRALSRTLCMD